jgi:hypothetical protein
MQSEEMLEPSLPCCEFCNKEFNPNNLESSNGEYHERREFEFDHGKKFPWQKKQGSHPYTFCSDECERESVDDYRIGMCELRDAIAHGDYPDDTEDLGPDPMRPEY